MPDKVRIGSVEIAAVQDADWVFNPGQFLPNVPKEEWKLWEPNLNDEGHMHSRVMTYVVRSQGKTIMVDAGVGPWDTWRFGNGHLPERLAAIDVSLESVDFVVPTHMHIDHVGWNTRPDKDGNPVPTFPNARYLFQQADWDHFTRNVPVTPIVEKSVLPMESTGLMELVGSEVKITDEVTLLHAPGHTPGQVAVLVQSGGEACLLIGDVCHHPSQLTQHDWSPVADIDGALSARSRAAVARMAKQVDALVAGGHFNDPTFGRMIELDGRTVWRGVDL